MDFGVAEDREINGFPPTHTKGWINPNDWGREGGGLRLGIRCLLPELILVVQVLKGSDEGPG